MEGQKHAKNLSHVQMIAILGSIVMPQIFVRKVSNFIGIRQIFKILEYYGL